MYVFATSTFYLYKENGAGPLGMEDLGPLFNSSVGALLKGKSQ